MVAPTLAQHLQRERNETMGGKRVACARNPQNPTRPPTLESRRRQPHANNNLLQTISEEEERSFEFIRESCNSRCIYLPFTDITRSGTLHDTTDIFFRLSNRAKSPLVHTVGAATTNTRVHVVTRSCSTKATTPYHVLRTTLVTDATSPPTCLDESPDSSSHTSKERFKKKHSTSNKGPTTGNTRGHGLASPRFLVTSVSGAAARPPCVPVPFHLGDTVTRGISRGNEENEAVVGDSVPTQVPV